MISQEATERLAELKRRYFPPNAELYLLLAIATLGGGMALHEMLTRKIDMAFAVAGALIAGLIVVLGGTRACLILYFATNVGAAFRLPGIPISLNQGFAVLFFASVIVDFYRYRSRFRLTVPLFFFIIFNIYYMTVTFLTTKPEWGYPFNTLFYLIPVFTIILLYWRESWLRVLLHGFVLVSILLVLLPGLFEAATGMDVRATGAILPDMERINGLAKDAILYAYTALWIVPIAMVLFIDSKNLFAKTYYFFTFISVMAISFLTQNRQTPIILAAIIAVFFVLVRYKRKTILLFLFVIAILAASPIVFTQMAERFDSASDWKMDYSLMIRRDRIMIARQIWDDHFWFGIGLDHFQHRWREYAPDRQLFVVEKNDHRPAYIDSGYIQIFTEFGFIGLLLFSTLIITAIGQMVRLYRMSLRLRNPFYTNMVAALAAMLMQLLVAQLISDAFIRLQSFYMLAILFALNLIIEDKVRELDQQQPANQPTIEPAPAI